MIVTGRVKYDNGTVEHDLECEHCGHKMTVTGPSHAALTLDVPRAGCPRCKKTAQEVSRMPA